MATPVTLLRKLLNAKAREERHKFSDAEARNILFYMLGTTPPPRHIVFSYYKVFLFEIPRLFPFDCPSPSPLAFAPPPVDLLEGIMAYKFALESYLGSISVLASERFSIGTAFAFLGALQGANQAAQCVGSILVAPLAAKAPTNRVLAFAIWGFALMASSLIIVEAATGGTLTQAGTPSISFPSSRFFSFVNRDSRTVGPPFSSSFEIRPSFPQE